MRRTAYVRNPETKAIRSAPENGPLHLSLLAEGYEPCEPPTMEKARSRKKSRDWYVNHNNFAGW